jgi:hypothetical protein
LGQCYDVNMNNLRKNKKYSLQNNARLDDDRKNPEYLRGIKETIKDFANDGIPLSDGLQVDVALTQGVWIDQKDVELSWAIQKRRFKTKHPALEKMEMPDIVAVYISSSKIYDMVRGEITDKGTMEEYGITAAEWLKEFKSAGCLMASHTGYHINIGGKPTYLIVICHKPQSLAKIDHEIRHVIEKELGLKAGTLQREAKQKK